MLPQRDIEKKIRDLSGLIETDPGNPSYLWERSACWQLLGRFGEALNDLYTIVKISPDDQQTLRQIHYIETILKFRNRDIYSDTNTSHDPWLE